MEEGSCLLAVKVELWIQMRYFRRRMFQGMEIYSDEF